MGVCASKSQILPSISHKSPEYKELLNSQSELQDLAQQLSEILLKLSEQAKGYIKQHRRGRGIYALKKMRVYSNLANDVSNQQHLIREALEGRQDPHKKMSGVNLRTKWVISQVEDDIKLIRPLQEREVAKEREEKIKEMFKRHHVENTDVYYQFAEYEAEAIGITLSTSATFKKSELTTEPGSLNTLDDFI